VTSVESLRARFDAPDELGYGIEEELFLVDHETLDELPLAREVHERADGDPRFKLELMAAQLEIVTPPSASLEDAVASLATARRDLAAIAEPVGRLMSAGAHPIASELSVLTDDPRYQHTLDDYGERARRQLVSGLHLHISLGGADRTLAVYNALRSHLPEIAALAANAPYHAGRDTGLASIRPTIAVNLRRQGVPPHIPSWEWFADALEWGRASDTVPDTRRWWFELRMHAAYGTLEMRVPDAQATVADVHGVAAFAFGLAESLAARHDAGEVLPVHDQWRIDENRWSAMRDGVEGTLADLQTGERMPTRELLRSRLPELHPETERLLEANGAMRARDVGLEGASAYLVDAYNSAPATAP